MTVLRCVGLGVLMFVFATLPGPGRAQPSDAGICIDPDMEFPVACDDDGD